MSDRSPAEEVRHVLGQHGMPGGLMPDSVAHNSFDEQTGDFVITLQSATERTFSGISVSYAKAVSGRLTQGAIQGLKGIKAKVGFWIKVTAIHADGDQMAFAVGPVKKRLPRRAFE